MSRRLSETMSKRKSLNRRSSRSSRYTGSAILDPDTDVIDNSHPYWWKNLENNTMGRPSIDFNMLNETSRQLDSNSQIEGNEAKDEWWKVLETLNSPQVVERNPKPDTAKNVSSTSESEEEPRIVKRKLPLRLRTKSHQANAFINALNDSKDPSVSEPVPETRKKSSLTKSDLDNKTITNKEQLTEALDSSLNQSLNSNNVLKSKPKIFKDYKDRNKNLFIDVLQNDELKVSFKERSFIEKSSKIMVRKDSSRVEAPLYNQSRSTDYMSSFEGTNDLSHLPAPKAQSTTLEHSTSHNSNRNDSASDAEHRIVKPKPRLLKRRSRIPKKNVFQDIFESEQTDEGAEKTKSTNKNVAENIEISKQFSGSSSDNLPRISQKPPEDIVNEENLETEENEALRLRKKRKSAIVATESIKRSMDLCLNSLGSAVKRKSTQGKSASNHNFIGGKTNENILSIDNRNETQVSEDVSSNSTNEEGPNKLQRRFEVNTSPTFNKKERRDTDNRSRVSTRNSNLEPSMKESTQTNARISDVGDKGIEETEDKVPTDSSEEVPYADKEQVNISQRRSDTNVLSSSNRTERRDTENRSRVSSRTSNLVSSMRKSFQKNARTSNVGDKGIEETEDEVPTDSSEEVPYADKEQVNISQRRSDTNVLSSSNRTERRDTENRSRVSSRTSNLVSSMRKSFQKNARTSNVGDKGIEETEDEVPTDSSEEVPYADKEQVNISQRRSAANVLSSSNRTERRDTENRSRVSSRTSNLVSSMKKSSQTNARTSNVGDKGIGETEDEVPTDSSEEVPYADKEQVNISQRRSATNVLSSSNRTERRDTENRSRVSSRTSNLVSSMKKSSQTNARTSNVGDKGIGETEDEVPTDSSEEVPYADKEQVNISQRRSATNVLSSSNRTERRDTENRSRVSSRTSNLVSSMKKSSQTNARTSNVGDKGIGETEDEVQTDSSEEIPYADMDKVNISQRRSATNVLSSSNRTERRDTENRSRVSSRTSNLVSSMRKSFQANARTSNVGDKEMEETENEVPTDFNDHEVLNKLHYADNVSEERSVDNTLPNSSSSDHRNTETRANYLASLANKIVDMNSSASTDIDENLMEIEDEVSSDSSKAEEQENIFERRSLTRISNLNAEEGNDTGRRSRLTTASNLASTQKRINQPNTDALDAEIPKKSQRSGPNTNIFQRMSGANTSSALNRKESTDTKNRTGALKKTSNLLSPFISTPTIREICKSKLQTTIRNFFSADRTPKIATKQLFSEEQNGGRIKGELEMMKKREMDCMDANAKKQHETKSLPTVAKIAKAGKNKRASKQVHKAYLVNGRVYRVPRLPRPKSWVTDRLYNYLWKCMEPKYKLETRVVSEKFVRQLSDVTSSIAKQKSYLYYRSDLYALMKEMARLGIIRTRNDFYNFCHDFFPYELRVKMVPMLLPGNKRNIPYDPNELHTPILDEFR